LSFINCLLTTNHSQLPINFRFSLLLQVLVRLPEVLNGPEPGAGQRTRVHVAEDQVLLRVDHLGFVVGLLAPEHEDHAAGLLVDGANHVVGKLLPALFLMAVALALLHSQIGAMNKR
jgi:hypothetical protein